MPWDSTPQAYILSQEGAWWQVWLVSVVLVDDATLLGVGGVVRLGGGAADLPMILVDAVDGKHHYGGQDAEDDDHHEQLDQAKARARVILTGTCHLLSTFLSATVAALDAWGGFSCRGTLSVKTEE